MTTQSGGNFLTSIRNLTVPFGILLAGKGIQLLYNDDTKKRARRASVAKSAPKKTATVATKGNRSKSATVTVTAPKSIKGSRVTSGTKGSKGVKSAKGSNKKAQAGGYVSVYDVASNIQGNISSFQTQVQQLLNGSK
jgi:hypothetical protein